MKKLIPKIMMVICCFGGPVLIVHSVLVELILDYSFLYPPRSYVLADPPNFWYELWKLLAENSDIVAGYILFVGMILTLFEIVIRSLGKQRINSN